MFRFQQKQQICEIGDVKLGGQPGQLPTVMIGSIFYHGDKIVLDSEKGIFNKGLALNILKKEEIECEKTGNKRIIDVNGSSTEALIRYINFIADNTKSPFLIDAPNAEIRINATKHVAEIGLKERAIYNSITEDIKNEEILAIKESGLKSAILLLYNKRKPTIDGRLDVLRGNNKIGLLNIAKKAGIEKCLIDTCVIAQPDPGPASKTIYLIKKEFGLPSGCAPHNAIEMWRQNRKPNSKNLMLSNVVAHITSILYGADFVFYGPLKNASKIYPACALADAYIAYSISQEYRIRPSTKEHPLYRIF